MKSEKGITLVSLIVYISAMSIVVSIVTVISTYFYSNISTVSQNSNKYKEYTKFNSYFTQEINQSNNTIDKYDSNYVVFSSGNQYSIQNNNLYFNKVKICDGIDEERSLFIIDTDTNTGKQIVTITLAYKGDDNMITTTYSLKDW